MNVCIRFRGQLATAVGAASADRDLDGSCSVGGLIAALAADYGEAFREITHDADGNQRRTLLVAVDGEQVVDFDAPLGDGVREITLMPPIAGG